jgi:uncharacterized integral membrane protein
MIRFIIGVLLGIVMIVFAIQNTETVNYQFFSWTLTSPRSLVVIVTFVVGLLSGWLVSGIRHFRHRKR